MLLYIAFTDKKLNISVTECTEEKCPLSARISGHETNIRSYKEMVWNNHPGTFASISRNSLPLLLHYSQDTKMGCNIKIVSLFSKLTCIFNATWAKSLTTTASVALAELMLAESKQGHTWAQTRGGRPFYLEERNNMELQSYRQMGPRCQSRQRTGAKKRRE